MTQMFSFKRIKFSIHAVLSKIMTNQSGTVPNVSKIIQPGDQGWDHFYAEELGIETSDKIVGSLFILIELVGLLGNGSAVCYFWRRRNKTIHDLLYLAITAVDCLTLSSLFAIVASLFNDRHPTLFKYDIFCDVWTSVIIFSSKMSMFLAMLICITRTIAMKCPHHIIERKYVVCAIAGYAFYIILMYLILFPLKLAWTEYYTVSPQCGMRIPFSFFCINTIELCLPSLVTVICFFVSIWVLQIRPTISNKTDKKFRRISVTIAIFAAIFLVCNIPYFFFMIWEILAYAGKVLAPSKVIPRVGYYYAQLMHQSFPIHLNAMINPILYVLRMQGFQTWIHQNFKKSRMYRSINRKNSITDRTSLTADDPIQFDQPNILVVKDAGVSDV
jgi:hypothetical protein